MVLVKILIPETSIDSVEEHIFTEETSFSPWSLHCDVDNGNQWSLNGYFEDLHSAEKGSQDIHENIPNLSESAISNIKPEDWQNAYKAFLKPWHTRNLHWIPSWERENYNLPAEHVALYMDAGMAFGTGSHETTRLCAQRLLQFFEENADRIEKCEIIDAGCGSGILALSAQKISFKKIAAFDIDPEAILVSRENAAINNIYENAIQWSVANLEDGLKHKQADLILANIQSDVLIPNAHFLIQALKPAGSLILSGILTRELKSVQDAFHATAQKLDRSILHSENTALGDWSDLYLTFD
jgi:ribosomal protein L11 methyltransferase